MKTFDIVGIGIGPFNLGLAALADPIAKLRTQFYERRDSFDWHPGMMLESAHLQVPFLADLVTLADPTSRFSFLNFLKHTGRIYPFYIRENFYALRVEYNEYCQWVSTQLRSLSYGSDVEAMEYDGEWYRLRVVNAQGVETVRAKHVVFGTGTRPWIPEAARTVAETRKVVHSSRYRDVKDDFQQKKTITIVGSGQSAAEIYYDLLSAQIDSDYHLNWISRSPRFFPLEYTKLTLEMTSPDYISHFHALPEAVRDSLAREQGALYKGIDSDLINAIFDLLYQRSVGGQRVPTTLLTSSELTGVAEAAGDFELQFTHTDTGESYTVESDAVILATGYRNQEPTLLADLGERILRDSAGRLAVNRDWSITAERDLFVLNAELHTHGFTAPDLGMGAHRNSHILNQILGREHYVVEDQIAFQSFGTRHSSLAHTSKALSGGARR